MGSRSTKDPGDLYPGYFDNCKKADEFLKFLNLMMDDLGSIFRGETIPISTIDSMISVLKTHNEIEFKGWLKRWMAFGAFNRSPLRKDVELFIDSNKKYFDGSKCRTEDLSALNDMVNSSWHAVNEWLPLEFKNILQTQLTFHQS